MDDGRFDSLTKSLVVRSRTRRGVFHAVTAGIAGGALGATGLATTEAKKKKKKCPPGTKKCGKKKKKCCRTTCISQSTCGTNCKCFFDVNDALACYDLGNQTTCCDTNAECGQDEGCVKGACEGGSEAGRCFALCAS